ncbi:GNAT family N-acetyltransferase [Aggregatilinea lenta]|uniref:GNAT family N-acetyltransferase n=1 Tax=Aggregatilinea lenta TaxID=913108 RepID=UPI000E5C4FC8|nr:GNAT family protein [Aggregatilinea lenta]
MPDPKNPILQDFPDRFESERLIIRAPRPGDGAASNEALRESLAELQPWMPWATPVPTPEDTELHDREAAAEWLRRETLQLLLFRKSDGLFVGSSGLHNIDWAVPRFEIGYWIRTSLSGQGYVTEAVNAITDFAFDVLGAQRLEIRCDARNERSAAVARRAGYALEVTMRHQMRGVDGSLRDTLVFVKLREDWTGTA